MKLIKKLVHPDVKAIAGTILTRRAARGIVLRDTFILLLFTDVRVGRNLGHIEDVRPHWKQGFDLMHMTSHFFFCDIDPVLCAPRMEDYETANGMRPVWVDLSKAIAHNRAVMQRQEATMGLSIQRETFMLEQVQHDLAKGA